MNRKLALWWGNWHCKSCVLIGNEYCSRLFVLFVILPSCPDGCRMSGWSGVVGDWTTSDFTTVRSCPTAMWPGGLAWRGTEGRPTLPQSATAVCPGGLAWWGLLVGCLTSQQHASVSQGRICTDNFTCCHTEIEAADQTVHLTQSQYTDTGPTSPSADPITPGAWQGSHWSANV